MTKKITELLELLEKHYSEEMYIELDKKEQRIWIKGSNQFSPCIWESNPPPPEEKETYTDLWNQLTGDNLKDVTWIL